MIPAKYPRILATCLCLTSSWAMAGDLLPPNAAFSSTAAGEIPGAPWKVKGKGSPSVKRESPAIPGVSENWVRFVDKDPANSVSLNLEIPQTAAGTLKFKLYSAGEPGTLGVYLGVDGASNPANRQVELKVMESGGVYMGSRGERTKLDLTAATEETLTLEIRFASTPAGLDLKVYSVDAAATPSLLHEQVFPAAPPITYLRIATDSQTAATDIYLGELSLQTAE